MVRRDSMEKARLVVEGIPFETFQEKIRITKAELNKGAKVVEVHDGFVYVERREKSCRH